jgi:hypothetical protein
VSGLSAAREGADMPGIVVRADDRHRALGERRTEELATRVADLEALLAEAVDTWTPLAQCDSEQEGDALTAFEARVKALLDGGA